MRIVIVGGNGVIGKRVCRHFSKKHETITAGRKSGDFYVDIANKGSIKKMFEEVPNADAVICVAGEAKWDSFENLSEEDFYIGIKSKLMGQVNLAQVALNYLNENGSITLTTGILADDPVELTTSAAMVNGGIHSFVKAAALEMKNGIRINAVASGLVEDAVDRYRDYFPGHNAIPMAKAVNGYVRSVEGKGNGEVVRIYD